MTEIRMAILRDVQGERPHREANVPVKHTYRKEMGPVYMYSMYSAS